MQRLTSLLAKVIPSHDLEKGNVNPPTRNASVSGWADAVDRDPQVQDNLNQFRHYVGIHNDPDLQRGRTVPNLGIYQRVVKAERVYKKQYKTYSWLINGALGLQIIFAAALTALGAGNGPRSAVTAFGAMNTVLAGILTFLKGSGLPNRMKYYENECTKVREYIEQREREFSRGNVDVDLRSEVAAIESMYETVKRDIEINTPDAFVSMTRDSRHPPPPLNRYAYGTYREVDDRMNDMNEKYQDTRSGLASRFSQAKLGLEARLSEAKDDYEHRRQEARADLDGRINNTRQALTERQQDARTQFDNRLSSTRNDLEHRAQGARVDFDNTVNTTRQGLEQRAQDVKTDVNTRADLARQATEDRIRQERLDMEDRITEARTGVNSQIQDTQSRVNDQINTARLATAAQVEETRHGFETRLEDVRSGVTAQVEDSRHGVESRIKEVQSQVQQQEQKILSMVEKVAEKVLATTQQRRHEHE